MLQPFAFKGDFEQVYRIARRFLYNLSLAGISVSLPDGYRSVTKNYDYGNSVTVVEVFPDIVTTGQLEQAEIIYTSAIVGETPDPDSIQQARRFLASRNAQLVLENVSGEGWRLRSDKTTELPVIFWAVPEADVLAHVKSHLDIQEEKVADDFDAFGDDLP